MDERTLSSLDQVLAGINKALTTVAKPAARVTREYPGENVPEASLSENDRKHAAALMRVNHAGEVAAQGLYQGHGAISRDIAIEKQMRQTASEELDHLGWCEQRLDELGSRPSLLGPAWYSGAFAIGLLSGALGDRWSLGFVEETERQVSDHLTGHLQSLPDADARSRAIVAQMRDEEERHGVNAKVAGVSELPGPVKVAMRMVAKIMTRTAYWM